MKILNFGSCNIDMVYSLEHIVVCGETEISAGMNIFPGGKGLNQSIALARAGAQVYHAGCIGSDGDMLLNLMQSSGVDVSLIKRIDEKNGHAIIQVSTDGDNCIFIYPGSNFMITDEYIDNVLAHFGVGDCILLQNEINAVDVIVNKAYEKGMKIVLNPSPINEKLDRIDFSKISYLILNEIEAQTLSGCSDTRLSLKHLAKKYPDMHIVLTLGKDGSIYSHNGEELFQPSFSVKTVDTTAAGDTFTGYFIAFKAQGYSTAEALSVASAAAAIAVSHNGAAPSIPCVDEVISLAPSMQQDET